MYLYGDMTIKVERAQVQLLVSGYMPIVVTTGHGVQTCRNCGPPQLQSSALRDLAGRLFRAVCTGTRPGVAPAIRAGKGWWGRREFAPRCSATQ